MNLDSAELPRQYAYNPRWWIIVFCLGSGAAWIALDAILLDFRTHLISLAFGLIPITLGVASAIRRLVSKRFLVLERDALILPTGFLHLRTARIPYISIERVWQQNLLLGTGYLCVTTKNGRFDIFSGNLPDTLSFVAVGTFLYTQAQQSANPRLAPLNIDFSTG